MREMKELLQNTIMRSDDTFDLIQRELNRMNHPSAKLLSKETPKTLGFEELCSVHHYMVLHSLMKESREAGKNPSELVLEPYTINIRVMASLLGQFYLRTLNKA